MDALTKEEAKRAAMHVSLYVFAYKPQDSVHMMTVRISEATNRALEFSVLESRYFFLNFIVTPILVSKNRSDCVLPV